MIGVKVHDFVRYIFSMTFFLDGKSSRKMGNSEHGNLEQKMELKHKFATDPFILGVCK